MTFAFFLSQRAARLAAVSTLAVLLGAGSAAALETAAKTAILVDYDTGAVLFEKSADTQVPPASLSKLMTLAVIFDELKRGAIRPDEQFPVSEYAWRTGGAASGGSTMFLPLNAQVSVEDLVKGIAIQSGNDATIVAAEGIAGSVPAFAQMMNRKAAELGLEHSHFLNPHGLPDPGQLVSARDLVTLATYLIREYPDRYPLFSEEEFTFNGITQRSRNPLLAFGADGLKTGHTQEAGYCLVASARGEDGRRVVFAMTGMRSANERASEARAMMTAGLRGFENVELLAANAVAGAVPVTGGVALTVPVRSATAVRFLEPRGSGAPFVKEVVPVGTVEAPVPEGRRVASLRVTRDGQVVREEPLYAAAAVEEAGFVQRIRETVMGHLGWGADTTVEAATP